MIPHLFNELFIARWTSNHPGFDIGYRGPQHQQASASDVSLQDCKANMRRLQTVRPTGWKPRLSSFDSEELSGKTVLEKEQGAPEGSRKDRAILLSYRKLTFNLRSPDIDLTRWNHRALTSTNNQLRGTQEERRKRNAYCQTHTLLDLSRRTFCRKYSKSEGNI